MTTQVADRTRHLDHRPATPTSPSPSATWASPPSAAASSASPAPSTPAPTAPDRRPHRDRDRQHRHRDKDRDAHLRSGDFFDADANPTITFVSDRVTPAGGGRYEVAGDLTMHGVTKPVVLDAEIGAPITDPWGAQRRAATASAKLNRKDWGFTWNQILEAGALLVSEDVKLSIDVQVTQQA
jgi:hypothetical protein